MDKFLDLPQHILEFATTEEHNKQKVLVVGQSGCSALPKILAISQHAVQS